jgi:hypothetical protein
MNNFVSINVGSASLGARASARSPAILTCAKVSSVQFESGVI